MAERYVTSQTPNGGAERVLVVESKGAKRALQVSPEKFDGVELRAVRRKVDGCPAARLDEATSCEGLVHVEVVHDHQVAPSQEWDETLPHESTEHRPIDASAMSHQARSLPASDGAEQGNGLPALNGSRSDNSSAAWRPAKLSSHSRLAERLVDEDESALSNRAHQTREDASADCVLRAVALYRDESLFFRE